MKNTNSEYWLKFGETRYLLDIKTNFGFPVAIHFQYLHPGIFWFLFVYAWVIRHNTLHDKSEGFASDFSEK